MTDTQPTQETPDLVVVGASAGGIEALSILIGSLPKEFPAPLVIAQHLDPSRPSSLGEILQHATSLQVVVVDGHTRLEPGHVYVVPSNRHVLINESSVEFESNPQGRPRPSVDLLLSTAAANYGERLIAVILTGSGSDGAVGAVEVKNQGGTVIIQNPNTARFPSMPLALPPTAVDHVADIERIGPLLYDLLTGAFTPRRDESTDGTLDEVLQTINEQANLDFRPYKTSTIIRRLGRRMAVTGMHSLDEYAAYLKARPEEVGELVAAFLINVTEFFRDAEAFAYLQAEVLPSIIDHAREQDRTLRLWSAGCATGEEPYSLAMVIADMLGAELPEWNIRIFATDLDADAISFARAGVYPENALNQLPGGFHDRFFEQLPGNKGYHILKTLRQMVIFGHQDLSQSPPFPRIDLVLCRNVLIYFTNELQEHVLSQFAFALRPRQGYLMLGKAETVRAKLAYYESINRPFRMYHCIASGETMPHLRDLNANRSKPVNNLPARLPATRDNGQERPMSDDMITAIGDSNQNRRVNDQLLRFLPVGVVVIDRSYKIISINVAARRMLGLRDSGVEQDFLHSVRGIPYDEARNAIDTAFRQQLTLNLADVILAAGDARERAINLSFVYMPGETQTANHVAITITDVTDQISVRRQLEAAQRDQTKLLADLESANQRLNQANKELVDANEQLQVANEELMLTHEELQASVEEFETTNEELQAANEELETSNEELQATNEELETTNEELRISVIEQQLLSNTLDTERARLIGMLELAPFYIILCTGPGLIVEQVDHRFLEHIGGIQLVTRPLAEAHEYLWEGGISIVELAQEAYEKNELRLSPRVSLRSYAQGVAQEEQFYAFTIVPRRDTAGHATGVVIYVANETLQQVQQATAERDRLSLIFEQASQVALALFDVASRQLLVANQRFLNLTDEAHQFGTRDLAGRTWDELAMGPMAQQADELWRQTLATTSFVRIPEANIGSTNAGQDSVWDVNLTPVTEIHDQQRMRYVLVSAVDISEQIAARKELERLDRLKDEFLSAASHELRTPLTTLTGYGHILAEITNQTEKGGPGEIEKRVAQIAMIIQAQLQRMNRLVEDIVDVTRLQSGNITLNLGDVNLADVVERAAQEAPMMGAQHPVEVDVPADEIIRVRADADRLHQVLINLLQNAITYAPASPQYSVRLRCVQDDRTGQAWAQIEVQDWGPGIPRDKHAAIFDRFFQVTHDNRRARKGLGLGLYIVRQIVEQHNGAVFVESESGQGSTFIVQLPPLSWHESSPNT